MTNLVSGNGYFQILAITNQTLISSRMFHSVLLSSENHVVVTKDFFLVQGTNVYDSQKKLLSFFIDTEM